MTTHYNNIAAEYQTRYSTESDLWPVPGGNIDYKGQKP
jgi:hypothetical protein